MEDKQIDRWLRRQFRPLGWTLIVYYGIFNLLVIAALAGDSLGQVILGFARGEMFPEVDVEALMNNGWGYIAAVAVGLTILYGWKGADFFKAPLPRGEQRMSPGTFTALLAILAGAQVINGLWLQGLEWVMNLFDRSVVELLEEVSGSADSFSLFLYAGVLAPISEELLFRGYVLGVLRPYGKKFSIVCSALLFALFHGNLLQAPYAFLAGLVLGYTALEYSVFWAIAVHGFNNLVLADLLTRLMELLSAVGQGIVNGAFYLLALAGAVILVVKRHAIREYNAEGMDARCVKCFFTNSGVIVMVILMALSMVYSLC